MGLATPDAVFFRWWELRAQLEAPPSQIGRWHGGLGIRPSPHCARCGADAVQWREDPLVPLTDLAGLHGSAPGSGATGEDPPAVLRARCLRCLSPWLLELVTFTGGTAAAPWSHRMSELLQLGGVLDQLQTMERRLYLQLYLLERVGDFEAVAGEANRRWPRMHPPVRGTTGPRAREWSRHTVRLVVLEARERVLLAMIDAGLWRFS